MKKMMIAILCLAAALACAGCTHTDPETAEAVNIAFVVGIADGETRINEGMDELSALPAQPGTDYAFVSAEGTPVCIESGTIIDLSDRGYTKVMMERVRAGIKADLAAKLDAYEPATGEIDMAGAIQLSVRTINAHAVEGRKNILVFYCSGKSSVSLINMVETPVYKLDIEASVPVIAEKMNLDMSNIDEVIWYCCGECGSQDQAVLSPNEKAKMKEFYQALFVALGMKEDNITFKDDLPSAECYQFADKPVSSMAVEGTVSGLKELAVLAPETFAGENALENPVAIPESMVEYLADSDVFRDPEAAAAAIQPVAEYLLAYPEVEVLLYGTCAGDINSEYTLSLGKARAASVRDVLVAAGVDGSRITVVSVKVEDDPYYQFGLGTGAEASVNRKSVVVDKSTEFARQILAKAQ